MYLGFTSTPIYNKPMLMYPAVGALGALQVPLHITSYKIPTRATHVNTISLLPRIGGLNTAYKSTLLTTAAVEMSLIVISGWTDTPKVSDGGTGVTLSLTYTEGGVTSNVTFIERMIAYMEGRAINGTAAQASTVPWTRTEPIWFRDPYGRVYSSPRVINLTGSFIEAVPGRTNFNLTLQV